MHRPRAHGEGRGILVSTPTSVGRALYRSRVGRVPFRSPFLLGVVPSQRLAERLERASRAPSVGWGEGFASPRLGSQRLKGRLSAVFCLERHSAFHARFLSPPAKIPTARARGRRLRLWGASCRPSACGDAAAPFRWLTGSMDGGGSHCSLVVTSRLVPPCRGWGRSSRHMRSLCSSCAPLGEGLHHTRWPSTAAPHCTAPLGRRVAFRVDCRR